MPALWTALRVHPGLKDIAPLGLWRRSSARPANVRDADDVE
jgi:hypothetical protein